MIPLFAVLHRLESKKSPHTYAEGSESPAASIHCSSVGSEPSAQSANASASKKSTPVTGWSSLPAGHSPFGHEAGGRWSVAATKTA